VRASALHYTGRKREGLALASKQPTWKPGNCTTLSSTPCFAENRKGRNGAIVIKSARRLPVYKASSSKWRKYACATLPSQKNLSSLFLPKEPSFIGIDSRHDTKHAIR